MSREEAISKLINMIFHYYEMFDCVEYGEGTVEITPYAQKEVRKIFKALGITKQEASI